VSNDEQCKGCLFVVATPIGNLADISARALEVLQTADVIAAEDTRHTRGLLQHFGINRPLLSLHEHNEDAQAPQLLERLLGGERVALVSDAGTPLISDPGFPLVRACREAGVDIVPVPGPSALVAALSVAGLPTDRFRFEGFLPRKATARRDCLRGLEAETATLVFYESSHRVVETLGDMVEVLGGGRYAVLARELTKLHETVLFGDLNTLLAKVRADENQRKGEFVLMLAGAVAQSTDSGQDLDRCLGVLLDELPLKQAARLAAKLSGVKRNAAYQRALELRQA
jgi:16S rRNA (cytidine1402-2'-O)-methyltransferase